MAWNVGGRRRWGSAFALAVMIAAAAEAEDARGSGDEPTKGRNTNGAMRVGVPAADDQRFRMDAQLQPQGTVVLRHEGGLLLAGRLEAKGVPICYGPGHIFADGFESP